MPTDDYYAEPPSFWSPFLWILIVLAFCVALCGCGLTEPLRQRIRDLTYQRDRAVALQERDSARARGARALAPSAIVAPAAEIVSGAPLPPANPVVDVDVTQYGSNGRVANVLWVHPVTPPAQYEIVEFDDNGWEIGAPWRYVVAYPAVSVVANLHQWTWSIKLRSVLADGTPSEWVTATYSTLPPPEIPDPNPPTSVAVDVGATIEASWEAVATDTNGEPETVVRYDVQERDEGGTVLANHQTTLPSLQILTPVLAGSRLAVRAVDDSGNVSAWTVSDAYVVTPEPPPEPPAGKPVVEIEIRHAGDVEVRITEVDTSQ